MSKFKVGDKVKIIECLCESVRAIYINKIATITKATENNEYDIDLDNGKYFWYPFEFELYIGQPEEYIITDLLNDFPAETKFLSNEHLFRIQLGELQTYDEDTQKWRKSINSLKQILEMKFTKVEEPKLKPMTFEEAVRTGNKIKYGYDSFIQDKFYTIQNIFKHLISPMYGNETVSSIILNNTWYAEGVYE